MDQWNLKKLCFSIMFLCGGIIAVNAQREFVATGGDAFGSGGSASYSVGQVGYVHYDGEDFRMNAGVQQPDILIMVDTDHPLDGLSLTAYPNPANHSVYIMIPADSFSSIASDKLVYQLHSMDGRLLTSGNIDSPGTSIHLDPFPSGYFILRIVNDNRELKSFKLFKTHQ